MKHTKILCTVIIAANICSTQSLAIDWGKPTVAKRVTVVSVLAALLGSCALANPNIAPNNAVREFSEGFAACSLITQGGTLSTLLTNNPAAVIPGGFVGYGIKNSLGYSMAQQKNENQEAYFGKEAGCIVGIITSLIPFAASNA
jgi:hypothetical protein